MAVLSDYTSGTITLANGSTAVTGTGTLFDVAKFREGDTLQIENLTAVIASVNSNTSLTLTVPWTGTTLTNAPYRARYLSDGARVTAQATTLIELLGNGVLSNLAEIGVEDGKTPVGNAAGEYELVDTGTLGIQDPNGSLAELADKVFTSDAGFLTLSGSFVTKATSGIEVENSVMAYGTPTAVIHGYKANGTEDAPTAVTNGQLVYGIGSRPYDGSGWAAHSTAAFHFIATEDYTPTNHGTALRVLVTPKGTDQSNRKQAISFESDGVSLGIRYKIPASGDLDNRAYFQDANGGHTALGVLGGGSGKNAALNLFYAGDPVNASLFQLGIDGDAAFISSAKTGLGGTRPLAFRTDGVERARIPTDGNLYVNCESVLNAGSATPGVVTIRHKPGVAHGLRIDNPDISGTVVLFTTSAGGAGGISVNGTTTTYNTSSDYRFKTIQGEVHAIEAWERIGNVKPRVYLNKLTGELQRGFIAHEWSESYPTSVNGKKDAVDSEGKEVYQTMSPSSSEVVADLMTALKDLKKRVEDLEYQLSKI